MVIPRGANSLLSLSPSALYRFPLSPHHILSLSSGGLVSTLFLPLCTLPIFRLTVYIFLFGCGCVIRRGGASRTVGGSSSFSLLGAPYIASNYISAKGFAIKPPKSIHSFFAFLLWSVLPAHRVRCSLHVFTALICHHVLRLLGGNDISNWAVWRLESRSHVHNPLSYGESCARGERNRTHRRHELCSASS